MVGMAKIGQDYEDNGDFLEFLSREFERTAAHSTVEELAEFAFGGLNAAVAAYCSEKRH